MRQKLTKLQLSGIELPAGSDAEIRSTLRFISAASDVRRTVNGDALNVSRSVFQRYAVSLSGDDAHPAALHAVKPGQYVEVLLPDFLSVSLPTPGFSVVLPRAGVEVYGLTSNGMKVEPFEQPASQTPLQTEKNASRLAVLRTQENVSFPQPVALVRFRPVLGCLVLNWNTDADERLARFGWQLELEEV